MKTHKAVLALSLAAMVAGLLAPAAVLADPGRQGGPRPHGGRHRTVTGSAWARGRVTFPRTSTFHQPHSVPPRVPALSVLRRRTSTGRGTMRRPPSTALPSAMTTARPAATIRRSRTLLRPPTRSPPAYGSLPPVPFSTTTFGAAPTRPSVIEFPTGRYELRGDGISTPYVWVWIPNPPPPPESAARMAHGNQG